PGKKIYANLRAFKKKRKDKKNESNSKKIFTPKKNPKITSQKIKAKIFIQGKITSTKIQKTKIQKCSTRNNSTFLKQTLKFLILNKTSNQKINKQNIQAYF
ncbi:hypothetical protein AS361_00880, partial [Myroides marinus]|uniref:hypothetical protein n=1 Tax=Myroides marinus TaxID=703342 RepID=UPI0007420036